MTTIYRVTRRWTEFNCESCETVWVRYSPYCGTDRVEARTAYLRARVEDSCTGFGDKVRETLIEEFDADAELTDETPIKEGL